MVTCHLRIAVIGAYGHPNFGDQLLFNILHRWLKEYDEGIRVAVPWGDKEGIDWPARDIEVGAGWEGLRSCDAIVYGGGGFFGERGDPTKRGMPTPAEYSCVDRVGMALHLPKSLGGGYFGPTRHLRGSTKAFLKYAIIARIAGVKDIPCCIIGTGLGPVTTKLGCWAVRSVLKRARRICLRDVESVQCARKLCPSADMLATADMVLSGCVEVDRDKPRKLKRVGVHLGPKVERCIDLGPLAQAVRRIDDDGAEVVFVVDTTPRGVDLTEAPEKIKQESGLDLQVVPYTGVDGLLETLAGLDMVLTTKLHVGMVAYSQGVFPLSIAAHLKTRRFYRQVGLEEFTFDLTDDGVQQATDALIHMRRNPGAVAGLLNERREAARQLALGNRVVLNRFLSEDVCTRQAD